MANSASPSPPVSASMWPASARSARLPDQSAPATSTTRNPHVSARVTVRRPRERAAAVCRCGRASIERIVAGSLLEFDMHRDRTLVLNGQRFHYAEWGAPTAPALLLLHGVTGHARTWDEEAAALASRYRVLALDQRGHGDSDPSPNADYTVATMSADVAALADSLGLDRVSIVGLSMWGRVPILLVRGADSDVLSAATAQRMLDENPNTRFAEVAGAGHTVPGDQPAAFQRLLTDFLAD